MIYWNCCQNQRDDDDDDDDDADDGGDDDDDGDDGGDDDDGGDGYSDDTPRCGSNHGDTCDFPAYRDKTGSSKLCSPFAQVYILLSICKYRFYPSLKIYDHQKHQHHPQSHSLETFSLRETISRLRAEVSKLRSYVPS